MISIGQAIRDHIPWTFSLGPKDVILIIKDDETDDYYSGARKITVEDFIAEINSISKGD